MEHRIWFIMTIALSLQVPGFRPGKSVPESIIVGYVGKEAVKKATIESILKRTLPHAMSSVRLHLLLDIQCLVTLYQLFEWK